MLQCPTCGLRYANDMQVCPEDGTPLQADSTVAVSLPADPLIGKTFDGKYRLDERLGVGGMGTVYRATHLLIDRPVAIKVLNPRFVEDESAQERFRREARAAGRLRHGNAVAVTDFGRTDDGYVYIVMELLEGHTLREVLAQEAPLDVARAVSLMLQISAAVAAAHEAGIIHRDLKPANIFIVQRPHAPAVVKVLDFGIAKLAAEAIDDDEHQTLTQVGVMIGTPRYMSPEQCDGARLTPAADVYSLGIILYEMLTGLTPFTGTSPLAIALKHSTEQPKLPRELVPTIPPALEEVVLHALAKRPDDRPHDAGAFRRELYATAERLGLEHAGSYAGPSLETLRSAGTETPSGRLVIDIERLRESRAARSDETTILGTASPDGAPQDGEQAQPQSQPQAQPQSQQPAQQMPGNASGETPGPASSAAGAVGAVGAAGVPARSASAAATVTPEHGANVSRISVPVEKRPVVAAQWLGRPTVLLFIGLAALALVIGLVALRSSGSSAGNTGERAGELATPTPEATPTPAASPSPQPTAKEEPRDAGRRKDTERESRPSSSRAQRARPREQPSKLGKIKNTLKKIFKNPF